MTTRFVPRYTMTQEMSFSKDQSQSQGGNSSHNYNFDAGLRNTTIRQILQAKQVGEKTFEIDDKEVGLVSIIANVYEATYDTGTGRMSLRLDDGTGRIKASLLPSENGKDMERELDKSFKYIHVIGSISEFKTYHSLRLEKINIVDEPHEIYYHALKVMVDSVKAKHGLPDGAVLRNLQLRRDREVRQEEETTTAGFSMKALHDELPQVPVPPGTRSSSPIGQNEVENVADLGFVQQVQDDNSSLHEEQEQEQEEENLVESSPEPKRKQVLYPMRRRDPYSHLTLIQRDIILVIQNSLDVMENPSEGVSVTTIVKVIGRRRSSVTAEEIMCAFDILTDHERLIYPVDDDHYTVV